jgi:hypothetical protein
VDDLFTAGNSIDYENLPGGRNDELETVTEYSHDLKTRVYKIISLPVTTSSAIKIMQMF